MNKNIALVVYPEFSMQEIANLCSLFRWNYGVETTLFSSCLNPVKSEEGIYVKPEKTFDEFSKDDYDALVLSGCSDLRFALRDKTLHQFLSSFKNEKEIVIGAICSAPIFLAKAGLLEHKKMTSSLFMQMYELFPFFKNVEIVFTYLVKDGNIISATGNAFNEFAIAIAREIGYDCTDEIFKGVDKNWKPEDFKHYLNEKELNEVKQEFQDLIL